MAVADDRQHQADDATARTGKISCWPSATVVMNLASSDQSERQIGASSLRRDLARSPWTSGSAGR
jgi:hypothetical protein